MTKQSSKQQTQIDNTEKALDILNKWFEEDRENRGFILIKSERKKKIEDDYSYDGNFSLFGMEDILTAGLVKCMSKSDNPLINILNKALKIILIHKNETKQN